MWFDGQKDLGSNPRIFTAQFWSDTSSHWILKSTPVINRVGSKVSFVKKSYHKLSYPKALMTWQRVVKPCCRAKLLQSVCHPVVPELFHVYELRHAHL